MTKKKLPKLGIFEWNTKFCNTIFEVENFLNDLPYHIAKQAKVVSVYNTVMRTNEYEILYTKVIEV